MTKNLLIPATTETSVVQFGASLALLIGFVLVLIGFVRNRTG